MKYVTAKSDRINWPGTTILHGYNFLEKQYDGNCLRWQGWPSGESTYLPPMWPGFDFRTRCHMWIEFVGSLLCYERFFPSHQKPTFDFIRIDFICE